MDSIKRKNPTKSEKKNHQKNPKTIYRFFKYLISDAILIGLVVYAEKKWCIDELTQLYLIKWIYKQNRQMDIWLKIFFILKP